MPELGGQFSLVIFIDSETGEIMESYGDVTENRNADFSIILQKMDFKIIKHL